MWLRAINLKTSFTFIKSLLYSCDITSAMWNKCKCLYTSKHKETGKTGFMGHEAAVSTQRSNLKSYHQGNTVMLTELSVHLLYYHSQTGLCRQEMENPWVAPLDTGVIVIVMGLFYDYHLIQMRSFCSVSWCSCSIKKTFFHLDWGMRKSELEA